MPAAAKWTDPETTASGKPRARVEPEALETVWFNTGTLCNIECAHCYIESSPKNDRLAYLRLAEVLAFLGEIERERLGTREIGFTGGEPFLNPDLPAMAEAALSRGMRVLILTNAMKPMWNARAALSALRARHGDALRLRVSLDHHAPAGHEAERGPGSWDKALEGLRWLIQEGFSVGVAGRALGGEDEEAADAGYRRLLGGLGLDAGAKGALVVFPEMGGPDDPPEISVECWGILGKSPASMMCASSRMVVRRKGAAAPEVLACTQIPYDQRFSLGATLKASLRPVPLLHPHCAQFCALGGATCSG
jgi:uncharacterized Fe-S cluster-containing radical SAM superfamily protein